MHELIFNNFLPNLFLREWVSTCTKTFIAAIGGPSGKAALLPPSSLDGGALEFRLHDLQATPQGWSGCLKNDAEQSQPGICGFEDKETEGQGIWKVSPSPTAFCLFPSSISPLPLRTNAVSGRCLQHPQSKSYPSVSTAKHSTDGFLFNKRETHWCLLPQVFPPPWVNSHLIAVGRSGSGVSASEEAEPPTRAMSHVGTHHVPWCGGIVPCHAPQARKRPSASSPWPHVHLGDRSNRGGCCPGWGFAAPSHLPPSTPQSGLMPWRNNSREKAL